MSGTNDFLRLKKILNNDDKGIPNEVLEILKSDIRKIFIEYFVLDGEDIDVSYEYDKEGGYKIAVACFATAVKKVTVFR